MQVEHLLPRPRPAVEDGPEVVVPFGFGEVSTDFHQVAHERLVAFGHVAELLDHLPRHDEQVQRRLRIDVAKGNAVLILVHNVRGNLAVDDLFEERFDGRIGKRSRAADKAEIGGRETKRYIDEETKCLAVEVFSNAIQSVSSPQRLCIS